MPRETIRNLSLDVERLLVAGAHLAEGDAGLERDQAASLGGSAGRTCVSNWTSTTAR